MERYADAITDLEKAIDLGEGTWDIFGSYAESLRQTGRTTEAIEWSYKTLSVVSSLVDTRGALATMLVAENRHYEALALLAGFDASLVEKGHPAYFSARRLAIETAIARRREALSAGRPTLRLPKLDNLFYVPVAIGAARPAAFVVDTGATELVVPRALLAEAKAGHRVVRAGVVARLADNRTMAGDVVVVPELSVGPFVLKDVRAFACAGCAALLGQEVLSRFDMRSSRVQGVEFMTLSARER
jgi:predicted aspartyl protease